MSMIPSEFRKELSISPDEAYRILNEKYGLPVARVKVRFNVSGRSNLHFVRKFKKITQKQLAEKCKQINPDVNLSSAILSRVENGMGISSDAAVVLAQALDERLGLLFVAEGE